MIMEQLCLFEEDKPKIKDVDYVDLSTLPDDPARIKYGNADIQYKDLPVGKYFMFKTGVSSPYNPKLGKVFPYVQNQFTGKILNAASTATDLYPKISLKGSSQGKIVEIMPRIHRLGGLAFLPIPHDFYNKKLNWVINHIDKTKVNYQLSNLEWVTQRQNSFGKKNSAAVQEKIKEFVS